MDNSKLWEYVQNDIDEQFKWSLDKKFKYVFDDKHYTIRELYCEALANLQYVSKVFGMTIESVKKYFSYEHYFFHCDKQEFLEKTQHLKNLFGKKYIYVIIDMYNSMPYKQYKGLYGDNAIYEIDEKIECLKKFFQIDKQDAIRFMYIDRSYIYMKIEEIAERLKGYANFLKIPMKQMKAIYREYPKLNRRPLFLTMEKAEGFAEVLQCDIKEIKKMYLSYPKLLFNTKTSVNIILGRKKYQTKENREYILKYPCIIDCLIFGHLEKFWGFESIGDMVELIEYLIKNFGRIVDVCWYDWKELKDSVVYFITKPNNELNTYFLICITKGEYRSAIDRFLSTLSNAKFNRQLINISYQKIEARKRYEVYDYCLNNKLLFENYHYRSICKKNKSLIRIPGIINNERIVFKLSNGKKSFDFFQVIVLNDDQTKRHIKLIEEENKKNNSSEEWQNINVDDLFKDLFSDFEDESSESKVLNKEDSKKCGEQKCEKDKLCVSVINENEICKSVNVVKDEKSFEDVNKNCEDVGSGVYIEDRNLENDSNKEVEGFKSKKLLVENNEMIKNIDAEQIDFENYVQQVFETKEEFYRCINSPIIKRRLNE